MLHQGISYHTCNYCGCDFQYTNDNVRNNWYKDYKKYEGCWGCGSYESADKRTKSFKIRWTRTLNKSGRFLPSQLLKEQGVDQGFPVIGINGYSGEQDKSKVIFSELLFFKNRDDADDRFLTLPKEVKLHFASYSKQNDGWYAMFGWWDNVTILNNPLPY